MAEWTGERRSGPRPGAPQPGSEQVEQNAGFRAPSAPGATTSPQMPGEVPDRSTVPGEFSTMVEPARRPIRRPLTEEGTAQAIVDVYAATPGAELDPARFEQAPVSDEEARKADPELLTPVRPAAAYALDPGEAPARLGAGPAAGSATTGHEGAPIGTQPTAGDAAATPLTVGTGTVPGGGAPTYPDRVIAETAQGDRSLGGAVPDQGAAGGAQLGESTWAESRPKPDDLAGAGGASVSEQVADPASRAAGAAETAPPPRRPGSDGAR